MSILKSFSAYKAADQSDLFTVLDETAATVPSLLPRGVTVANIMNTWTTQPGYPLLSVSRTALSSTVTFTQVKSTNILQHMQLSPIIYKSD
jgi:aminopeptidase N